MRLASAFVIAAVFSANTASAQTIVTKEPGAGGMRRGEILLVDNGKCPERTDYASDCWDNGFERWSG